MSLISQLFCCKRNYFNPKKIKTVREEGHQNLMTSFRNVALEMSRPSFPS